MSPWTTPPKVPEWRGPRRVHIIRDDGPRTDPSIPNPWEPWTLLTQKMLLRPAFKRAAGCWNVIGRPHG